LAHKIELFKTNARVFRDQYELFAEQSWVVVLLGQGIMPTGFHPIVNNLSADDMRGFLEKTRADIEHMVSQQPSHQAYLHHLLQKPSAMASSVASTNAR